MLGGEGVPGLCHCLWLGRPVSGSRQLRLEGLKLALEFYGVIDCGLRRELPELQIPQERLLIAV